MDQYIQDNLEDKISELCNEGKLYVKGTELARRTGCILIKEALEDLNELIMHYATKDKVYLYILNFVEHLMRGMIHDTPGNDVYVMSNKLGSNYKSIPAHGHLAKRMIDRGDPVQVNERIQYEYTHPHIFEYDNIKIHKYEYMEKPEYMKQFGLKRAYLCYLRDCVNPFNDILSVRFNDEVLFINKHLISQRSTCMFTSCKNKGTLCTSHSNISISTDNKTKVTRWSGRTGIFIEYKKVAFTTYIYNVHLQYKRVMYELVYKVFGPVFVEHNMDINQYETHMKKFYTRIQSMII